jgi:hypothetical protein
MHSLRQSAAILLIFQLMGCNAAPHHTSIGEPAMSERTGDWGQVQDEVLVGLEEEGLEETLAMLQVHPGVLVERMLGDRIALLRLPPGLEAEQAVKELKKLPGVRYAEPNRLRMAPSGGDS